jgi:thiosulfate dehydrogenase
VLSGCAENEFTAVQHGSKLFKDETLSSSPNNDFTCSTCHDTHAPGGSGKKTGAALAGVTERPSYWGGAENDLLASINACLRYFMLSTEPLSASDEKARALYAYLESLEPRDPAPVPFTIVSGLDDIPRGDAAQGAGVYAQACRSCHGERTTGAGRLTSTAPILPEDTIEEHADYSPRLLRLVFIEKTRHGPFLGYGGNMPPFSSEVLSDAELGSVLEYLNILGQ